MIEQILPAGVASAELREFPAGLLPHPAEESLIARAVEKRRRDFIGARHCARIALGKLGEPPAAILKGEKGQPLFPRGIVGSLTHCEGYQAAVLAHAMRYRSVGIDAEPHEALPDGVLDAVSLPAEREWLLGAQLAERPDGTVNDSGLHLDRLLFCAKEATYKAWFPLTERWLGFEDAHITFETERVDGPAVAESENSASGTFHSDLLIDGKALAGPPLGSFDGRWLITDGYIFAAIVVA